MVIGEIPKPGDDVSLFSRFLDSKSQDGSQEDQTHARRTPFWPGEDHGQLELPLQPQTDRPRQQKPNFY